MSHVPKVVGLRAPNHGLQVRETLRHLSRMAATERGKFLRGPRLTARPPRPGAMRLGRMRATAEKRLAAVWREADARGDG